MLHITIKQKKRKNPKLITTTVWIVEKKNILIGVYFLSKFARKKIIDNTKLPSKKRKKLFFINCICVRK